jgi:hypothetical protein
MTDANRACDVVRGDGSATVLDGREKEVAEANRRIEATLQVPAPDDDPPVSWR